MPAAVDTGVEVVRVEVMVIVSVLVDVITEVTTDGGGTGTELW